MKGVQTVGTLDHVGDQAAAKVVIAQARDLLQQRNAQARFQPPTSPQPNVGEWQFEQQQQPGKETEQVMQYSPDTIIIVVSNPLDVMTYCAYLTAKIDPSRVFGMAGILDTARYKAFLAEALNCSPKDIQAVLMGGHGDTMVPLPRYTTVAGIPVTDLISTEKLNPIIERTKKGGGELVNLMGTSAWYAPGAAAAQMVEAIIKDEKRIYPCCAWLQGEYGLKDIYLGVPVKLGTKGIEEIITLNLNDAEMALLTDSAKAVKEVMGVLDNMKLIA